MHRKKLLAATLALTAIVGMGSTADAAKKSKKAKKAAEKTAAAFDPAGFYKASIGFEQTEAWRYRNEITNEEGGLEGSGVKEAGLNYETDVMQADDGIKKIDGKADVTLPEIQFFKPEVSSHLLISVI